jgi:L-alanine-DL-glutamate epimerase-like enolase superfamily enzyme
MSFKTPVELNEALWPKVLEYGKLVTSNPKLRATYALNALVAVDNAAWVLFARENGLKNFDDMIPPAYRPALSARHTKCASIPLFSYKVPVSEIKEAVDSGYFFMKIKIGQPGTQTEMLAKDMARVSEIHETLKNCRTPYTKNGKLPYYFDANGRYQKKETLFRFIDHLKKIGAYEQVAIIEEPFDEYDDIDVNDIPIRLAADESAHTVKDAIERIEMGYRAMALKPIAKTMSMSMKIAQAAYERKIPCFCADLTVCPVMIEWNKAVAARLPAFPGIGELGLIETNGHQNFRNWETMRKDLAYPDARWTRTIKGVFECDADYYAKSGGILEPMPRYEKMYENI